MTARQTLERVLMTTDAVGGVWRWSVDAVSALASHGVSCVVAGLGPRPSAAQAAEITAIPCAELVWLDQPLEWLAEGDAAMRGLPAALAGLARERRVDLIHVNSPAHAADVETDLPMVAASHSCVVTWWRAMRDVPLSPAWDWQFDRALRGMERADMVLTPSTAHAAALQAAYSFATPVVTVLNPSAPVAEGGLRVREVLAAARWWDEAKNGALLDAAAEQIDAPVVMVGALESPQVACFEAKHAQTPGPLPAGEVRRRMASASVFASPSIYEPFGLSALEAAGAGTALVLADIPTYRELWQGAALFHDPHDPAALAAAVNRLLADEALRRSLGHAARLKAQALSPDRQARGLLATWRQAMDMHACTGPVPAASAPHARYA